MLIVGFGISTNIKGKLISLMINDGWTNLDLG